MGVVLCSKLVYNVIQITTPSFHCTPLCRMQSLSNYSLWPLCKNSQLLCVKVQFSRPRYTYIYIYIYIYMLHCYVLSMAAKTNRCLLMLQSDDIRFRYIKVIAILDIAITSYCLYILAIYFSYSYVRYNYVRYVYKYIQIQLFCAILTPNGAMASLRVDLFKASPDIPEHASQGFLRGPLLGVPLISSFAEKCGDLRRLTFSPVKQPTSIAEFRGDDESARKPHGKARNPGPQNSPNKGSQNQVVSVLCCGRSNMQGERLRTNCHAFVALRVFAERRRHCRRSSRAMSPPARAGFSTCLLDSNNDAHANANTNASTNTTTTAKTPTPTATPAPTPTAELPTPTAKTPTPTAKTPTPTQPL